MATLGERIVEVLRVVPAGLDDDELAARLGVARQAVNQACRKLAAAGRLNRGAGGTGKIINTLDRSWRPVVEPPRPVRGVGSLLTEDEVKGAVREHLVSEGYQVRVAWGRERGIDIEATRAEPPGRLVIEAKGETLQPQQVNYFLGALGELVQRMDDPKAQYGLALPDNGQYRGLIQRLPALIWTRLNLTAFFHPATS